MTRAAAFFTWFSIFACLPVLTSCFPKKSVDSAESVKSVLTSSQTSQQSDLKNSAAATSSGFLDKDISQGFRFVASIEREALRILRPQNTFRVTQFEVISFIFDQRVGIKRSSNLAMDCNLYDLKRDGELVLEVYKRCEQPASRIAVIEKKNITTTTEAFRITFYTKEWGPIVGITTAATQPNRICELTFVKGKAEKMSCAETAVTLSTGAVVEELRLSKFEFQRNQKQQLLLEGGVFKDLTQHKKLKLNVPLQGKIKIIEKELEVKDDFADKQKIENTAPPIEIKSVESGPAAIQPDSNYEEPHHGKKTQEQIDYEKSIRTQENQAGEGVEKETGAASSGLGAVFRQSQKRQREQFEREEKERREKAQQNGGELPQEGNALGVPESNQINPQQEGQQPVNEDSSGEHQQSEQQQPQPDGR